MNFFNNIFKRSTRAPEDKQSASGAGSDFAGPDGFIPVESVREEYAYLAQHPCACGGSWKMTMQALFLPPNCPPQYKFDRLEVECPSCGAVTNFVFRVDTEGAQYKAECAALAEMFGLMDEDEN